LTIINGILFFLIAVVYSSAGFGGGSMYLALLAQSGADISWVRFTGLSCNAVVTAQGSWHFARQGWMAWKQVLLLLLCSVPACIYASGIQLSEKSYLLSLAFCLLIAGLAILIRPQQSGETSAPVNKLWLYPASAIIGFISGITGIGGGVYLSPLLHLTRWGSSKHIAAASAAFILINSIASLMVQYSMGAASFSANYWVLIGCVLLGGFIGSLLGSSVFSQRIVRYITGGVILFASLRLLSKYL
jgi:uncharacterized membrane protein YfcA